jgi:hypothetical protein
MPAAPTAINKQKRRIGIANARFPDQDVRPRPDDCRSMGPANKFSKMQYCAVK